MEKRVKPKKYRILYVGNFEEKSVGEPEIAKCLEELGHSVTRLPEKQTFIPAIIEELKKQDYDFLLFAKFRVGTYEQRAEFLKSLKIPSVMWGFDLYWGL